MLIVVSYDIPNDRRRTKVMKALKDYGRHVQYSVFECDLNTEQYKRLRERIENLIEAQEDNVRFYPLNQEDARKRLSWGVERSKLLVQAWYLVSDSKAEAKE